MAYHVPKWSAIQLLTMFKRSINGVATFFWDSVVVLLYFLEGAAKTCRVGGGDPV